MTPAISSVKEVPCATNHLRCLIVDDNSLNLAILSMMLKRRFSHVLDGPPIAVDAGLKAIQALRQEVFDVILLDIQMPHISGIDITKRIRAGTDGILQANRDVIILATTTAVGPAPTALYRSVGMNGVLPKPVRPGHLASFLGPLVRSLTSSLVPRGDGSMVRAPQQSAITDSFFMPESDEADRLSAMSRPDICDGGDFEGALAEQTKASLKRVGMAGRSTTLSGTAAPRSRPAALRVKPSASSIGVSSSSGEELPPRSVSAFREAHRRGNSVSISSRTLKDQLAREVAQMEALEVPSDVSDSETGHEPLPLVAPVSGTAAALVDFRLTHLSPIDTTVPVRAAKSSPIPSPASPPTLRMRRPLVHHRASSPAWLARWESAIEAPDMSFDVAGTMSTDTTNSIESSVLSCDSAVSRPHSAPASPVAAAAVPKSVSSPVRSKLSRPKLRAQISNDGSGSGSGSVSGHSASSNFSSLSTAWSSFSLRTPSEEDGLDAPSSTTYLEQWAKHSLAASRDTSPERRRSSACTMTTSTDTSLASSPRSEYPPQLLSTNALLETEDSFTKSTCTSLHTLAVSSQVVVVRYQTEM